LYIITPEYPEWAVEQGIETEVSIEFWVNPKGKVKKSKIIQRSGYLELDIIAKRALGQWLFDPLEARLPQKDQWGTVLIKYRLE
ncbi:energy transducer TonB, partial [Candidatus Margulisiibacteriota bacterium]